MYTQLYFDSKEEAVNFADRSGWKYTMRTGNAQTYVEPGSFNYSQNFLPTRVRSELINNIIY
jgi:hypothetical protein